MNGDSTEVIAFAATGVEARPLRRRLAAHAGVRVEQGGTALAAWGGAHRDVVVSCGLAGGLDGDLATGTVVIPDAVAMATDDPQPCDPQLVAALRDAAVRCGVTPHRGAMVTVDHVVTGPERALWAGRGYVAVDMESALLRVRAQRFAAVRVILDTPARELSPAWERPHRAMASPWLWGEALWLARVGPGLCDVVARVVAEAFSATRSAPARGTSVPPAQPVS